MRGRIESALRWLALAGSSLALAALPACERPSHRSGEDAALAAAVEQSRLEQKEADRALRERAIAEELARRDAEQAEIDAEASREAEHEATMARLEERLRGVLVDPGSMQLRNARLTADGTLCTEFNARNKQGVYLGFRRAVVSDIVLSLEQDPDDAYREPQQRFAQIARATGCY